LFAAIIIETAAAPSGFVSPFRRAKQRDFLRHDRLAFELAWRRHIKSRARRKEMAVGENKTVGRPAADAVAHAPMRQDLKRVIR
jgi:hypothetical protein